MCIRDRDDPIEMAGFCAILRDFGYQVAGQANTGRNAVAGVRQTQPDLILMDINMPETDGLTALEEINRERIIPCIIITGYKDPTLTERASQAGVFGYLQKPIDEYEIRSAIEIALRRFNEYEQLRAQLEASKQALADRKVLDRAKGILMDTMGMTEQPVSYTHLFVRENLRRMGHPCAVFYWPAARETPSQNTWKGARPMQLSLIHI